jgi:hypothetical protein
MATGGTQAMGDADGDCDVDGADFAAWQASFTDSVGTEAAVPEGNTVTLAALSALAWFLVVRSRHPSVL